MEDIPIDFDFVLKQLLEGFDRLKLRYAAIGGFALAALGAPRATKDLDFMIHRDDLEALDHLLSALKFRRILRNENFSQYEGETALWGTLDFQHAFRPLGLAMLDRALIKPFLAGTRQVRVLQPEDVIGLKIQAIANNPKRRAKDTADIQALLAAQSPLDWKRIEEFYGLFGMTDDFKELRERFE